MEKILESLRNYKAHSFPFLKPVQKKEAPNYYDSTFFYLYLVITHPMDLYTVLRQLMLGFTKIERISIFWQGRFCQRSGIDLGQLLYL
jgi:hypothetical protein